MGRAHFYDNWVWVCIFTLAVNDYRMSSYYVFYAVLGKVETQKNYTELILFFQERKVLLKVNQQCKSVNVKAYTFHGKNLGSREIRQVQVLTFLLLFVWFSTNYLLSVSLSFIIYKFGWNTPFSHWGVMGIEEGNSHHNNWNNYFKKSYVNYKSYTNVIYTYYSLCNSRQPKYNYVQVFMQ